MSKIKLTVLPLSLFVISLNSCYYDKEEVLYKNDSCDTTDVSYRNEIQPIINNNCAIAGCHVQGGTGVGLYENYTQTKASVDKGTFFERVVVQKTMPPSEPLSQCQIDHIKQWVNNGAPNN